ncbi:MAG: tRNA (adenosine(37)-N6)-dimethylallyltransferase MiaA [Clostridia bacterium]|nr:tRNA (adenosine(37)-N6)-dimethylallyltransferase MiaA [Clostridia bacterium]
MKPRVIVILGPTASGKTALSIELAKAIDGEIVSCDSMQIYKDMTIGTAKPEEKEQCGIKHYLIDFVSPDTRYTVSDYRNDAKKAIKEILEKGKMPIVVGGTGLYADSLIYEIDYPEIAIDKLYRQELEKIAQAEGLDRLYKMACNIDEQAMKKISPNDQKRILRVLEIYHDTGKTKTEMEIESRKKEVPYDYHVFAINMPRDILYNRIDNRVEVMIEKGLIEEVEDLFKKYSNFPTAMQGIGYKEIKQFLDGKISKEEAIDTIKKESRHYAKRQMTWFRKNKQIVWLDGLKDKKANVNYIIDNL